MKSCSIWTCLKRHPETVTKPVFGYADDKQQLPYAGLARRFFCSVLFCIMTFGNVVHAQSTTNDLLSAAMQRLHWAGIYEPDIKIVLGEDSVATVSGTVASDVVKSEIVETLQMTDGVRGVIDRLVVAQ